MSVEYRCIADPSLAKQHRISNSMGVFLQKTNIIRDYLEDLDQTRTWWPDEIWYDDFIDRLDRKSVV